MAFKPYKNEGLMAFSMADLHASAKPAPLYTMSDINNRDIALQPAKKDEKADPAQVAGAEAVQNGMTSFAMGALDPTGGLFSVLSFANTASSVAVTAAAVGDLAHDGEQTQDQAARRAEYAVAPKTAITSFDMSKFHARGGNGFKITFDKPAERPSATDGMNVVAQRHQQQNFGFHL